MSRLEVAALSNLGYTITDQTLGNIRKRHSMPPVPERQKTMTWREFIRIHTNPLIIDESEGHEAAKRQG
jgi:hypothetical protein